MLMALAGKKGSGKSTLAELILEHSNNLDGRTTILSFATPLYHALAYAWGMEAPRTEIGRAHV